MTTNTLQLTSSRRGAWIINISKYLSKWDPTDYGLLALENITFAGKCGSFLVKLSADNTEQLPVQRVQALARYCGITRQELSTYLQTLQSHGCLDWDDEETTYEVLSFTRQRVLTTTSKILEGTLLSELENALPFLLEFCLRRPRLGSEVRSYLSNFLQEKDVPQVIGLVVNFELLGVIKIPSHSEELFFNGYQFGNRAQDIGKALTALSFEQREQLNHLLEEVVRQPGIPPESIRLPEEIKTMAIGLGLVEVSEVASKAGKAAFLIAPQLGPPSVGRETEHLEDDVFNHAKMLLSSFRYGELRSEPSRGRIFDPPVLVSALLDRDRVGPCTAIGEDYMILEAEGVIRTTPSLKRGQFYMELRRREPAEMVLGLLRSGHSATFDAKALPRSLDLPVRYAGPERARPIAARRAVSQDPESMRRFLEELRT
jgi:hypothetical protein